MKKIHLHDENEVREKLLHGISEMNALVSKTLGKDGKSVMVERGRGGEPLIVDDGRRVAEMIKFDDPIEQMATRVLYGVTRKTDEKAGDGTTTAMVLAHAIVEYVFKERLGGGGVASNNASVSEIDNEIQVAKNEVLEMLHAMKKSISTEEELANVATLACGDEVIGAAIGKMYKTLGKDGHISMEFNLISEEVKTEVSPGMRFLAGYADKWMCTDEIRNISLFKSVHILIAHIKDLTAEMIKPIVQELQLAGKQSLVIIAPKFTPLLMKTMFKTAEAGFQILCVRAPGMHEEQYKDIAIWVGGKYHDQKTDISLATVKDLGFVKEIEVTDDTCQLTGGYGDKATIAVRVNEVKAEAEQQKMPQFKQARLERISSLLGGVGVIKIGAPVDEDRNWKKYKIEDAKWATKHAYNFGVVPGGGMAFKNISDKLPKGNILKEPLLAPYKKLKENSPNLKITKNIVDPTWVEETAFETACSAAAKIIRIGGVIAHKPKSELEEAFKSVNNEQEN